MVLLDRLMQGVGGLVKFVCSDVSGHQVDI